MTIAGLILVIVSIILGFVASAMIAAVALSGGMNP